MASSKLAPLLPASLRYAHIQVNSDAHLFGGEPDDDPGMIRVTGKVTIRDFGGAFDGDEDETPIASIEGIGLNVTRDAEPEITILSVHAVVLDLLRVENVFESLDADSEELTGYCCLFDPDHHGELHPDLDDQIEGAFGGHVVILERARLAPAWRGLGGVGRYLVGRMLPQICCDPAVVAAQPFPLDVPRDDKGNADEDALKRGLVKVRRTWKSIGFEPYRDDIWILDPKVVTLENALKKLERQLGYETDDYSPPPLSLAHPPIFRGMCCWPLREVHWSTSSEQIECEAFILGPCEG